MTGLLSSINSDVFYKFDRIFIGIKKLLNLIDMARQTDEKHRVIKLITKLQDDGCLEE